MTDLPFKSVGVIGTGRYGGAVVRGFARSDSFYRRIWIYDIVPDCAASLAVETGARQAESLAEIVNACDVLVIAVSDPAAKSLLSEICKISDAPWIVSISSGITHPDAAKIWPHPDRFIRCLPNILSRFGCGQIAVSLSGPNKEAEKVVKSLFEGVLGLVYFVREEDIPAFRATAGLIPALFARFLENVIEETEKAGFSEKEAEDMIFNACLGVIHTAEGKEVRLEDLKRLGQNPDGATFHAMRVLNEKDFEHIMSLSMKAALGREREKENSSKDVSSFSKEK